jgi:hypothetical protein
VNHLGLSEHIAGNIFWLEPPFYPKNGKHDFDRFKTLSKPQAVKLLLAYADRIENGEKVAA